MVHNANIVGELTKLVVECLPTRGPLHATTTTMLVQSLLALAALAACVPSAKPTVVRTSTGYYHGVINETYPDVRAFLSIPYGQSTAGANRFMAPKAVPPSVEHFDVSEYPPACKSCIEHPFGSTLVLYGTRWQHAITCAVLSHS
jgi:hypothetical protein